MSAKTKSILKQDLWIGGEKRTAVKYRPLINPFNGETLAEVAVTTLQDADDAIQAAYQARRIMAKTPAFKRAEILLNLVALLKENREEAVRLIVAECAKPLGAARGEVERSIQTYAFAAEEARRITSETVPMDAAPGGVGKTAFIKREPIGVIGAITPFNFPMNLPAHKIGPAIAAGNTIVLKPSPETPLSAFFIADLLHRAGLPSGALNVLTGDAEVGEKLVTDPRIAMITFTGSPPVGKRIRELAGLKKVTLELGSNSAVIIDNDTNLDRAVERCVLGAFAYQGQVCISLQRIYAHKDVYQDFLDKFLEKTKTLTGGDPFDESVNYSALIRGEDTDRVLEWINEAKTQGATVAVGGERTDNMITPVVLTDVKPDMKVSAREIFGPAVCVTPVENIDEAIAQVNNSDFGLQAGVFTNRMDNALKAADELQVGAVLINEIPTFRVDQMPYGGVKNSGAGREGLKYALEEMTEMKLIILQPPG